MVLTDRCEENIALDRVVRLGRVRFGWVKYNEEFNFFSNSRKFLIRTFLEALAVDQPKQEGKIIYVLQFEVFERVEPVAVFSDERFILRKFVDGPEQRENIKW